jgi:hypothetical protein
MKRKPNLFYSMFASVPKISLPAQKNERNSGHAKRMIGAHAWQVAG